MRKTGMILEIILVILFVLIVAFIIIFNSMVTARQKVKNAWSQIDVQLKKRADLVDNLVGTVKGYATHEKTVFEDVAKTRSALLASSSQNESISQSNALMGGLKSVLAVAEGYPELKANENFLELQMQLVKIEDDIAMARMVYNDVITIYNTLILSFPQNLIAPLLGYKELKQLEADEIEKAAVKVGL